MGSYSFHKGSFQQENQLYQQGILVDLRKKKFYWDTLLGS